VVIEPGTNVVCIDASNMSGHLTNLTEGSIYFCEEIHRAGEPVTMNGEIGYFAGSCSRDDCGMVAILRAPWGYFCPNRFRPLIESLPPLSEAEQTEREPADA
jgi:hypothetical protein